MPDSTRDRNAPTTAIESNNLSEDSKKTSEDSRTKKSAPDTTHEPSDASKESPDYPSAESSDERDEYQQLGTPSPSDADNVRVKRSGMPDESH